MPASNHTVRVDYEQSAAGCAPDANQVAIYGDENYFNSCKLLDVGSYPTPWYLEPVGNDNVSSIRVGSNVKATLCEHDYFQGICEEFLGDDPGLGDNRIRKNTTSSVKVEWRAASGRLSPSGVAVSSALPGWSHSRLIDGDATTKYSSYGHGEHLSSSEWAALILPYRTTVNRIRILPRYTSGTAALGFPKDFVIQYSWDGDGHTCDPNQYHFAELTNWQPMVSLFGCAQPQSGWVEFTTTAKQAGCVRILGTELSQDDYGYRYLQLAEAQLYYGNARRSIDTVIVSGALPGWPASYLIDNDSSTAYSSMPHGEHLASAEWAAVILPYRTTVDQLRVYPRYVNGGPALGFPKDFVIQYSWNGDGRTCDPYHWHFADLSNWQPMKSYSGFTQPQAGNVDFSFSQKQTECIRLLGAELSQDDYGYRYLQLSEIEAYGSGQKRYPSSVAVSSQFNSWPGSRLIDGDTSSVYSSTGHGEHLPSGEWAAVLLPYRMTVDQVILYPRYESGTAALGFPKDFIIQYAWEGDGHTCDPYQSHFTDLSNWQPMVSQFGFQQPTSGAVEFAVGGKQAGCVRILGTELSQDDYGYRYLQLAEIELRGSE